MQGIDEPGSGRERGWFYPILLLLLTLLFFWKLVVSPDGLVYSKDSDFLAFVAHYKFFTVDSLRQFGQLSLWDPYSFAGAPSVANPLTMYFHPLHLLYYFIPFNLATNYFFIINTFLAGLLTYCFLRILRASHFAAFISALLFMLSSKMVFQVHAGFVIGLSAVPFIPLAFLTLEFAFQKGRLALAVLPALALSMILISGLPQLFLYILPLLFLYWLVRSHWDYRESGGWKAPFGNLWILILAVLFCFMISAYQFIPSLELTRLSVRSTGLDYAYSTGGSLHPAELSLFVAPKEFLSFFQWTMAWEEWCYMGVAGAIFALAGVLLARDRRTVYLLVPAAFALLFAMGRYLPVYRFFYELVPGFAYFRVPSRMLYCYALFAAALAGLGIDHFLHRRKEDGNRTMHAFLAVLIILGIAFSVAVLYVQRHDIAAFLTSLRDAITSASITGLLAQFRKVASRFIVFFTATVVLMILHIRGKTSTGQFKIALCAIVLLDLFSFGSRYVDVRKEDDIFPREGVVSFLETDRTSYRVVDMAEVLPHSLSGRNHIQKVDGYDPTILTHYLEYVDIMTGGLQQPMLGKVTIETIAAPNLLNLLNVKYLLTYAEINDPQYELAATIDGARTFRQFSGIITVPAVFVYRNKDVFPRAFVVRNAAVIKEASQRLERLKTLDPAEMVILEEDVSRVEYPGEFQAAEVTRYRPNNMSVEVTLEHGGFLVLSEVWYPGWRATDNGREVKVYKANHALRSIPLEKGHHEVKLVFDPISHRTGRWVSLATLCALPVFLIVSYRRHKQ